MRDFLSDTLETALMAMVIFLVLQATIQNFRVEGPSMVPTLNHGEHLLVNKLVYLRVPSAIAGLVPGLPDDPNKSNYVFQEPQREEVLVFHFPQDPDRDFVKRIIGVPGDTVAMEEGRVFLNGQPLDEPYILNRGTSNMAPVRVPPKSYFVLGDNRPRSNDSRTWSFIFVPSRRSWGRPGSRIGRSPASVSYVLPPRLPTSPPARVCDSRSLLGRLSRTPRAFGGCTIDGRAVSSVGRAPDF